MSCLYSSTLFLIVKPILFLSRGPCTASPWAAFFPTLLTCADQVSCVSKITASSKLFRPPLLAVLGVALFLVLVAPRSLNKEYDGALRRRRQSSPVATTPVSRDRPPGNRREAMDCGTWLQGLCHALTALTRSRRVFVCLYTSWIAQGRWIYPVPLQPAWHDVWKWLTGRAFGTFCNKGVVWFTIRVMDG
jgi:hypothetical protein